MKTGFGLRAGDTAARSGAGDTGSSVQSRERLELRVAAPARVREGRPLRELLRTAGRLVLWALFAVVLVRGVGDIVSGPAERSGASTRASTAARFPDREAEAFAVRFARVYLTWQPGHGEARTRAVESLLALGLRDRAAVVVPRRGPGEQVAEATVARESFLGSARALITVACSLSGGATRYLTVPIARDRSGGLVVFDLPSLSAPPRAGQAPATEPQPLAGTEGAAMTDVVRRFLSTYLAGGGPSDLAYFLAPGASVAPMPAGLALVSVEQVGQLGSATASGVPVVASVRVRDRGSGATYPLRYRLGLVRHDRWYVWSVGGAA